jgi:hypothetical protein
MTVEEILAELGVTVDPAKASVVKKWNTTLSAAQGDAQTKLAAAQKQMEDAQALQRVIDDNIRTAGLTETNVAQLQANNAALTAANAALVAAVENIKKQGFTGLNIPDLPKITPAATVDPIDKLQETILQGFTNIGQTLNEMNRYQRITGKPLPEDPVVLADKAKNARMSVHDYVEQTYKLADLERTQAATAAQKEKDDYAAQKLEEYKAAHPITTGHPELGSGVPSNYPNIPKPSDAAGVREMSGKSPMEKIRMARDRVSSEIKTRMAAA